MRLPTEQRRAKMRRAAGVEMPRTFRFVMVQPGYQPLFQEQRAVELTKEQPGVWSRAMQRGLRVFGAKPSGGEQP